MKKICAKMIAVASLALATHAATGEETPKGWFHAGSRPKDYEMVIDRSDSHGGKASASLKSVAPDIKGFGTLMQTFKADTFRGKRVRMSGYVRSKDVGEWAGLWMRVDGAKGEAMAFDNMQRRAIKGTSGWTRCEIVLDVPEEAQEIAFGLLLTGKGQVWMDDLSFEVVGKEVPTTAENPTKKTPASPVNLNFEE